MRDVEAEQKQNKEVEETYEYLIEKNYFKNTAINKYGHKSFLKKEKIQIASNPLEHAWNLKKEADAIYYSDKKQAYRKWLESLFLYLHGDKKTAESIGELSNFAKSIIKFIDLEDKKTLDVFTTIYLSLEYFVQKISLPTSETHEHIDRIIMQAFAEKISIIPIEQIPRYITEKKDTIYYN